MSRDISQSNCRLCLRQCVELFNIHESVLSQKITDCTSLEVHKNDNLPQSICKSCFKNVEFSYLFRNQCLEADKVLRNCMGCDTSALYYNFMNDSVTVDIKPNDIKLEIEDVATSYSDIGDGFDDHENKDYEPEIKPGQYLKTERESLDENRKSLKRECKNVEGKKKYIKKNKNVEEKSKENNTKEFKIKSKKLLSNQLTKSKTIKKPKKLKIKVLKRHQCHYCGKAFKVKEHYVNHTRTHTGEKPFVCDVCSKAFIAKHQLKAHSRTHTRERPFSCMFCGNRFLDHSARNRHQKIHTNDKKYPCTHCDKRFMTKYDLNKHIARHTGVFHKCSVCFQSYQDASSLTKHMKLHSDEEKVCTEKLKEIYCNIKTSPV